MIIKKNRAGKVGKGLEWLREQRPGPRIITYGKNNSIIPSYNSILKT